MRLLVSIFLILSMTIASGIWFNHSLQGSAGELTRQIDQVCREIREERWEAAIKQTEELEKIWEQKAKYWPVILDHQEMDNIEFSLAKVMEYVASQDNALSLGQLSELKLMIEHIPRKEEVNLENIL
ncbi:DUF4363 family protein [Syntrophomonas erecta]